MFRAALTVTGLLALIWLPGSAVDQGEAPVYLGRIDAAYEQPSSIGRALSTIEIFNNHLYAGYGDYTADTGPIEVVPVDLATGTIGESLLSHATEAIYIYRKVGDEIFAPDIDPRRTRIAGFSRGVAGTPVDRWTDEKVVRALHIFDVATFDGADLWLFGSQGSRAMAWRSTDGGTTWTTALSVDARAEGRFARLYSAFTLDGRLYAHVSEYPGGMHSTSMVFDGAGWTTGPRLIPAFVTFDDIFPWKALRVGDKAFYMDAHSGTTNVVARVYQFDGERASLTFGPTDQHETRNPQDAVLDITVSDDTAYVLNRLQQVWSSTDLANWTLRVTFEVESGQSATCIAVTGNDLYVGTNMSGIYRVTMPPLDPAS